MKHGIWGPDYETDFCFVFFAKLQEVKNEAIQTKKYIFSPNIPSVRVILSSNSFITQNVFV